MRGTVAKRLRRASGFVPSAAREYLDPGARVGMTVALNGERKFFHVTKPITRKADARGFYKQLKKAYHA